MDDDRIFYGTILALILACTGHPVLAVLIFLSWLESDGQQWPQF